MDRCLGKWNGSRAVDGGDMLVVVVVVVVVVVWNTA